jgi:hypothetical protein
VAIIKSQQISKNDSEKKFSEAEYRTLAGRVRGFNATSAQCRLTRNFIFLSSLLIYWYQQNPTTGKEAAEYLIR